jgi:hypothetical protein
MLDFQERHWQTRPEFLQFGPTIRPRIGSVVVIITNGAKRKRTTAGGYQEKGP